MLAAPFRARRFSASISWRWNARRDDQAELVDVDRLLVEIVGAHRDRLQRAFARAVAAGDDHLGVGLEPQDLRRARRSPRWCRRDRAAGRGRASPPPARPRASASIAPCAIAGEDDLDIRHTPISAARCRPSSSSTTSSWAVHRCSCAFPFGFVSAASAAARVTVKLVPCPRGFRLRVGRPWPDQRPRLESADAEAARLGRNEGLEQALADEVGVIPSPYRRWRSPPSSVAADADVHRLAGGLASTAFCTRWTTACSSASASTSAQRPSVAEQRTSWSRRLRGDRRGEDRPERQRRTAGAGPANAARGARADRSSCRGAFQRRHHVGAEFGIVGVPFGVAREQR